MTIRLAMLLFLSAATPVLAQQPEGWVTISEPGEWSEGRIVNVPAGTRIRIVGQAFHRAGVRAVRIGEEDARMRPAPGGVVDFEGYLIARGTQRELTVTVVPVQGDPIRRTLRLSVAEEVPVQPQSPQPQAQAPPSRVAEKRATPSTSGTLAGSMLLPGLGQFRSKRPVLGALFLAGAGASLGAGVAVTKKDVQCRSGLVNGECPPGEVAGETVKRPLLIPGLAGFVVLGLVSGLEASAHIKRNPAGGASGFDAGLDPHRNAVLLRFSFNTPRW